VGHRKLKSILIQIVISFFFDSASLAWRLQKSLAKDQIIKSQRRPDFMKTKMAAAIVIILLFSASLALAGPGGRGMGGGGYGRGSGYGMTPSGGSNLNLTPEQSTKLQQMQEAHLKEMNELQNRMFGKQAEMRALWTEPSPDREKILAKDREISELQGQMTEKATRYRLDYQNQLTDEQKSKLPTLGSGTGQGGGMGRGPGAGRGNGAGGGMNRQW
jgi:Spy/CpxP family protein refolding chaperone